jgi:hypothetical protein
MVRLHYPGFTSKIGEGRLVIQGTVRPTAMSDEYHVRIEYEWNRAPRVYVVAPTIVTNEFGDEVPHRHTDSDRPLCLFYSKHREWSPYEPISTTTIPWTAEWLFFYEVWHATRMWLGGGIEHEPHMAPQEEVVSDA